MRWRFIGGFLFFFFAFGVSTCWSGIIIGGTRVVFPGNRSDTTISVINKDTSLPYLVQVWVDPFMATDKNKPPFIAIPPVSRLEPKQERVLRIIKANGDLPTDRESVFWLNVKNIPPSSDKQNSKLEIAIKTRIKLFWRPANITEKPETASLKVKWQRQGNVLVVNNPTAIHINVIDVAVDGHPLDIAMIKPFDTLRFTLPAGVAGKMLTWHSINDYGAISDVIRQPL
ncbi:fimbrial chaperone [Superficieibacter sp. 1612_C1]|jgi:fimbrial chaperone protein|uniref:fimbrial chaperone n=1 Tax=Superficieibacter sp. 1612_C1 TaxID=2780382 RepID=UPI0018845D96|nr:fimbrial chaperone [Superficieibacter sp. 1612_C1]